MPFSFNPTVSNGQGGQEAGAGQAPSFASATPEGSVSLDGAPKLPDSPLLFLRGRGDMMSLTLNAYAQMLLMLIAFISILAAITLFVYGYYLKSSIEDKKALLVAQEASFKEYPFAEMKRFSDRMAQLDALLKGYVSIRSPLKLLEDVVERRVYFNNFTLNREKSGGYTASFTAVTTDYQALIQQLEALKLTQYTKVAPTPKIGKFTEELGEKLQVVVTTPVMVQGVLPDEVVFLAPGASTSAPEETVPEVSSSPAISTTTNQQ